MKNVCKKVLLVSMLGVATWGQAADWLDVVIVWLVTKCAITLYSKPEPCCCHCKDLKNGKLTLEQLQAYREYLKREKQCLKKSEKSHGHTCCVHFVTLSEDKEDLNTKE